MSTAPNRSLFWRVGRSVKVRREERVEGKGGKGSEGYERREGEGGKGSEGCERKGGGGRKGE